MRELLADQHDGSCVPPERRIIQPAGGSTGSPAALEDASNRTTAQGRAAPSPRPPNADRKPSWEHGGVGPRQLEMLPERAHAAACKPPRPRPGASDARRSIVRSL